MNELTRQMLDNAILSKDYCDDLVGDFCGDYFGGRYEDLFTDGLEFYFPECQPSEIAFLHTNVTYEDLSTNLLHKLLACVDLPKPQSKRAYSKQLSKLVWGDAVHNAKLNVTCDELHTCRGEYCHVRVP